MPEWFVVQALQQVLSYLTNLPNESLELQPSPFTYSCTLYFTDYSLLTDFREIFISRNYPNFTWVIHGNSTNSFFKIQDKCIINTLHVFPHNPEMINASFKKFIQKKLYGNRFASRRPSHHPFIIIDYTSSSFNFGFTM